MRGVFVFTITVLFILSAMNAGAEEITLDVDTAVSLALRNNLGLKTDRIDLEMKERAKKKYKPIYQQKGTYYCKECGHYHRHYSGIGRRHWKHRRMIYSLMTLCLEQHF